VHLRCCCYVALLIGVPDCVLYVVLLILFVVVVAFTATRLYIVRFGPSLYVVVR
jgi:hypothetical protein